MSDGPKDTMQEGEPPRRRKPARKPFLLRLPPSLHSELRGWADSELRSLNAHIEFLLREAVKRRAGRDQED